MKKNALQFFFIIIFVSCIILNVQGHGKKQIKALNRLSMAKRNSNNNNNNNNNIKSSTGLINTSHFETIPHLRGIRILPQQGLKEKDSIEKLPGQPDVNFSQYGGYVTVNESTGRALYYYFAQAQHSKDSLPLLLWLNGGPGCSSLGYGAMQELGPFRVHSDGKTLHKNLFAWNHAANVLFVETPAGVGFSYSNTTSDYDKSGDKFTAADNYVFLLNWLERFPEYKDRDFYISGESYAGHYVPQLAHTILHYNKQANKTLINLKGIIIGNAVINDETDTKGVYNYLGSHGIISYETSSQIEKYCYASSSPNETTSKICGRAMAEADMEAYYNDKLDIYNIYAPVCTNSNLTLHPKKTQYAIDPCSEYYTYAYLNRPEVQEALHANVTKLDHPWASCWADIPWKDSTATVIPLLKELMANSLRVWIYSGDTDGVVPMTSTQYSINAMNLKIKSQWHPWILKGQLGGYTQVYEGDLTFATVRGAGHQVPSYEPRKALGLIMHFLSGKPLPSN